MIGSFGTPRYKSPYMIDESGALPTIGDAMGRAGGEITAQSKPSFFGQGGTGRTIAGYIGDYLSQMAGGHPVFQQIQMQKMQDERAQRQSLLARQLDMQDQTRKRQEGNEDFYAHKQWELDHPAPAAIPAAVTIAQSAGLVPGSPEWKSALTAAIPGYGYTAPVMQAKTDAQKDLAGYRADRSAGLKAMPTYAQRNPKAPAGRGGGKAPKLPTGFILD